MRAPLEASAPRAGGQGMTSQARSESEPRPGGKPPPASSGRAHARLVFNLGGILGGQLDGGRCEGYIGHLPVRIPASGAALTPDVVVVCTEPEFEESGSGFLLNPVVVVEIHSGALPPGGASDHTVLYEQVPSLREYLLVAADRVRVEHRFRRRTGGWGRKLWEASESLVPLDSIGCVLPLRDVYRGVLG
jgi:Uma2 family endonuclease